MSLIERARAAAGPPLWLGQRLFWKFRSRSARRNDRLLVHDQRGRAFVDKRHRRILLSGRIVWGHLIKANRNSYHPGAGDYLGVMVFSPQEHFDRHPTELIRIAVNIREARRHPPADAALNRFAAIIDDDYSPMPMLKVPAALAEDREAYVAITRFHRAHLPIGRLMNTLFPLMVTRRLRPHALVPPLRYWPVEMIEAWKRAADAQPPEAIYDTIVLPLNELSQDAQAPLPPLRRTVRASYQSIRSHSVGDVLKQLGKTPLYIDPLPMPSVPDDLLSAIEPGTQQVVMVLVPTPATPNGDAEQFETIFYTTNGSKFGRKWSAPSGPSADGFRRGVFSVPLNVAGMETFVFI